MKLINLQLVFLFLSIGLTNPTFSQERTWQDVSGKFQVQAEYLGSVDDKVVLKKHNGNVIRVPLSKLSPTDLDYLKVVSQPLTTESSRPKNLNSNERAAPKNNSKPHVLPVTTSKSTTKTAPGASTPAGDNLAARRNYRPTPIEVPSIKVTKAQISALPKSIRGIADVLHDGSDPLAVRDALTKLAVKWPGDNETILNLVRKSTSCDEKFCRKKSLMLLGKHDLENSFPFVMARMDDRSFEIRWAAMEYVERSADPRALIPLVDRFIGPDRAKISLALITFGKQAEPYLQEYLEHYRSEVRMETCLLLGKMGTAASLPLLENLAQNDPNSTLR